MSGGLHNLSRLRRWNGLAMLPLAVLELAYGVSNWQYLNLQHAEETGGTTAEIDARWLAFQNMEELVMNAYMIVTLLCLVLGGTWIYGAVKNAAILDPGPRRISPGWAIGWHVIPFANLFMPFRAMKQTWNSSVQPPRPLDSPAPPVLTWWWGLWLATMALGFLAIGLSLNMDPAGYAAAAWVDIANTPLMVASIYLWWLVIDQITDLQAGRRTATHSHKEVIQ